MSLSNSLEWHIFRELGCLLDGRLTKHYLSSRPKRKSTKFEMRCDLFEVLLRETLMMNFDLSLPRTHQDDYLEPVVRLLNSLVNERFIATGEGAFEGPPESTQSKAKYPKLYSLVQLLKLNREDFGRRAQLFDLVRSTRSDPTIFHIDNPNIAKDAYKKIFSFHSSLPQILPSLETINRKRARSPSEEFDDLPTGFIDTRNDIQFRKHASIVFDALHRYLVCKSHKVMLRPQKQLYGELDLFLSGCQNTELWQEVRCLCYMSGGPACQIDNICEALAKSTDQRIQLIVDVDADPDKIHRSTLSAPQSHPEAIFSESLDKLIENKLLREINLENAFSLPANIFSRRDKYTLAYTLAICFLNFFDAGFMTHSWNSSSILFLVPKSHKTQEGFLYIRCSPRNDPPEERYLPGHPVLTSFARLLLEIYCGQPLPSKIEKLDGLHLWAELCSAVSILEDRDRNSYLKAVSGCLRLDQHLTALKDRKDTDFNVRELVYKEIVRHLESELAGLTRKRPLLEHNSLRIHGKLQDGTMEDKHHPKSRTTTLTESRNKFNIAIICALPLEADAAQALFDEIYEEGGQAYAKTLGDENIYTTGRIGNHNIVLCHLPEMGTSGAASVATGLQISYPHIELTLVVGICGGVPFPSGDEETEIHLGDIIISDSLIKYDFGQQLPDKFQWKSGEETLGFPGRRIQGLLKKLRTTEAKNNFQKQTFQHLQALQNKRNQYQYPGVEHDKLFPASYNHKPHYQESLIHCICSCCRAGIDPVCNEMRKKDCDALGCTGPPLQRKRHTQGNTQPFFHIGKIACADTVMKSGKHRDRLAKEEKVIGFEMEGAGVWGRGQCLIVKGVSDYADSHKNNKWRWYAAATAASGAKAFLSFWASNP